MSEWVTELSILIKAWMAGAPERNLSSLHRKVERKVSYGTVKHAANGDHEVSLSAVVALVTVVIPSTEGRKKFFERHFLDYLDFAKELFEDERERDNPPTLSKIESRFFRKLSAEGSLRIDYIESFLGPRQYQNFLNWLDYFKLARESGEFLVTTGSNAVVEDFNVVREMTFSAMDEMDPSRLEGDLLKMAVRKSSIDSARECWHIQMHAHEKCEQLLKNNPGDHPVLIANVMKFN